MQWKREFTMETILIELRKYVRLTFPCNGLQLFTCHAPDPWLFPSTKSCPSLRRARLITEYLDSGMENRESD